MSSKNTDVQSSSRRKTNMSWKMDYWRKVSRGSNSTRHYTASLLTLALLLPAQPVPIRAGCGPTGHRFPRLTPSLTPSNRAPSVAVHRAPGAGPELALEGTVKGRDVPQEGERREMRTVRFVTAACLMVM